MFSIRGVERSLFPNPEVDCFDYEEYPLIDIRLFMLMKKKFCANNGKVHIFFYVVSNSKGIPYVDIYVWDYQRYEYNYRRFVIREGYCFSETEEDEFLYYVSMAETECAITVPKNTMRYLYKKVNSLMPSLHYCDYSQSQLSDAMAHLYFASHRSGPREILYKSQLSNIAANVENLVGYNVVGTTPIAILNCEMPLKLIRILNQPELVENLLYYNTRKKCIDIYNAYSDYIDEDLASPGQWRYLELLYEGGGRFGGRKFSRALYRNLVGDVREIVFLAYSKFFEYKDKFPGLKLRLPKCDEVIDIASELEYTYEYKTRKSGENELIRLRSRNPVYEYYNDLYEVKMPRDGMDICIEAIRQGNCLAKYTELHSRAITTIMFLRKKSEPQKSFVDIEIYRGEIEQVYATYNTHPSVDVYKFLEEYALAKGLVYDPDQLIHRDFDEDAIEAELIEYIRDYRKRIRWTTNDRDVQNCYQTSLWDLYPDLMGDGNVCA